MDVQNNKLEQLPKHEAVNVSQKAGLHLGNKAKNPIEVDVPDLADASGIGLQGRNVGNEGDVMSAQDKQAAYQNEHVDAKLVRVGKLGLHEDAMQLRQIFQDALVDNTYTLPQWQALESELKHKISVSEAIVWNLQSALVMDKLGLFPKATPYFTKVIRSFSKRILGDDGALDNAKIQEVLHQIEVHPAFVPYKDHFFIQYVKQFLNTFLQDGYYSEVLRAISEPIYEHAGHNWLCNDGHAWVKETMLMQDTDPVTAQKIREAILAAFLSCGSVRQNKAEGNCPATGLLIFLSKNQPRRLFDGLVEVANTGVLTLTAQAPYAGESKSVKTPVTDTMNTRLIHKTITIDAQGHVLGVSSKKFDKAHFSKEYNKIPLEGIQGFRDALTALGYTQPQMQSEKLKETLLALRPDVANGPVTIKVSELLDAMILDSMGFKPSDVKNHRFLQPIAIGQFTKGAIDQTDAVLQYNIKLRRVVNTYCAQSLNPLLEAFKNTLLSVQSPNENHYDHVVLPSLLHDGELQGSASLVRIAKAAMPKLPALGDNKDQIAQQFAQAVVKAFREITEILYSVNASDQDAVKAGDQGRHCIYEKVKVPASLGTINVLVTGQDAYRRVVERSVNLAFEKLGFDIWKQEDEATLETWRAAIVQELDNALAYSAKYLNAKFHISKPWQPKLNLNTRHLTSLFFDYNPDLDPTKLVKMTGGQDRVQKLMEGMIDLLQENRHALQPLAQKDKDFRLLAKNHNHVFTVMPGQGLEEAWAQGLESGAIWVQNHVIEVGKQISARVFTQAQYKEIVVKLLNEAIDKPYKKDLAFASLGKKSEVRLKDIINTLAPYFSTTSAARNASQKRLMHQILAQDLDFPKFMFCDPNYYKANDPIVYSFVYNPLNEQVEIWANKKGSGELLQTNVTSILPPAGRNFAIHMQFM